MDNNAHRGFFHGIDNAPAIRDMIIDGDKIGEIKDVLVDRDGKITALIVGAGGFLGMGEKDVAVPFNAVQVTSKDNNKWYLVMNSTKDALKAAKGFKYDRDAMTWMPEDAPATTGTPARRPK